jgi:hypothetical protein
MALNMSKAIKKLKKWETKLARTEAVVLFLRAWIAAETTEERTAKEARIDAAETAADEEIPEE